MTEQTKSLKDLLKKIVRDWLWLSLAVIGVFIMSAVIDNELQWYIALPMSILSWNLIINAVVRVFPDGIWPLKVKR